MKKLSHVKVLFLLCFLSYGNLLFADFIDPKVIRTNWINNMYNNPNTTPLAEIICLEIESPKYSLDFMVRVYTASSDLSSIPPVYISYNFNGASGVIPILDSGDIVEGTYKEETLYEWNFPFSFDVSSNCTGQTTAPYLISYALVTPNPLGIGYVNYSIQDYPQIFPPNILGTTVSNYIEKTLCCPSPPSSNTNEFSTSNGNGTSIENVSLIKKDIISKNEVNISPNPFRENINIEFELLQPVQINISLIDINGKEIYSLNQNFDSKGKQTFNIENLDIPNGLYFLRLSSNDFTSTQKLVKVN